MMADSGDLSDFDELRKAVKDIQHRLDSLEDKVMMEQLEDLAIEDELDVIKDLVGHSDTDIKRKLNLLEELDEKYSQQRFDEKLRYLYTKLKELEQAQDDGTSPDIEQTINELDNRVQQLSSQISSIHSGKEGQDLDDVYDKLYLLRDKVKELEAGAGDGDGDIDDAAIEQMREQVQEQVLQKIDELRDDFTEQLDALDERHAEKVQSELASLDSRLDEQLEALEYSVAEIETRLDEQLEALEYAEDDEWREDMEDQITQIKQRLSDISTADLHDYIDAEIDRLEDDLTTDGRTDTETVEEIIDNRLETIEDRIAENTKAIEYGLEKHDEDLDRLKAALREAPDDIDEETYTALNNGITNLEERLADLKSQMQEQVTADVVRDVLTELDDWQRMQGQVDMLQEGLDETVDSLEDRIAAVAADTTKDLDAEVERIAEDLENIQENVVSLADVVERNADHRDETKEQISDMQDALNRLGDVIDDDLSEDELLEALEYSSDSMEQRMEEILVRIEHLKEDLENHEERIDAMSRSQNMFESEIGKVIQGQKELNNKFEQEDEAVNQKIDMLLEALEEGLDDVTVHGTGIDGVQEAASTVDAEVETEQVTDQQRNIGHVEVEERPIYRDPHDHMKRLAQIVLNNEKRIKGVHERLDELSEQIDTLSSTHPTIVE